MDNFETMVVLMVALSVSGLATLGFVGWWLQSHVGAGTEALEKRADELDDKADEHGSKLGAVRAELHHARMDLAQLRTEVGLLRAEVGIAIHGPPSMRAPAVSPETTS